MGAMASQITSVSIVHSTVCSGTNKRKHQSSASLPFVRGIHQGPVNSPHKRPVTQKMSPFVYVIMNDNTGLGAEQGNIYCRNEDFCSKSRYLEQGYVNASHRSPQVTNLKNLPKFQMFNVWNKLYTRHTSWSCLIRCASMTDGQTDKMKPVYPPFNFIEAECIIIPYSCVTRGKENPTNQMHWFYSMLTTAITTII